MTGSTSAFSRLLDERRTDPAGRRWLFVPYDQLSDRIGPLSREDPAELGIVIVENRWKAGRRPYHKQKLAVVLANLRWFALEQAERGVAVRHVVADGPYRDTLEAVVRDLDLDNAMRVMTPAERELRVDLAPLIEAGVLEEIPHEGWLTTTDQFERSRKSNSWRMDAFYRIVRRERGILMEDGKPVGGKFSFDADNRKRWTGDPPAPELPTFAADPVKEEVAELLETHFAAHPGTLTIDALPATHADANDLWSWAQRECMTNFGPFEDAMSTRSSNLFHTRVSGLVHLHRILPADVVADVERLEIPLASKEGFIRQVLGWREFMRHVHVATDGFRELEGENVPVESTAGDGGYADWTGKDWPSGSAIDDVVDGGAAPSFLGADGPIPPALWGAPSGLACLDRVVRDVWDEGYGHHITRLMIVSNLATLLDLSPRSLTDWFWVAYTDAYDWVVEPNVLGMGTFALGDRMTTKPYVSGAAYIDRMSDYCATCAFHPKKTCPITPLYWAFLARHRKRLSDNPRMRMPYATLAKRSASRRRDDRRTFETVRERLACGERLDADLDPS